ncbi:MAG TPA: pyridoxamine 5'-phosphate oxidase [Polyangiaceae bacterium]|nr:pyridoxamine 5'-phosphate oxidase [Polyangiaceae bacterium]
MSLSELRRHYSLHELREETAEADPFAQFRRWFDEALGNAAVAEPNAMTLATIDRQGYPAARTVLLKGFDERGFVFYTNYESAKGRELAANPRAALVFFWAALERQVRVTGAVGYTSDEESDAYFASRPRGSQLGAWASTQSAPVSGRPELEARLAETVARFGDGPVPRPPRWGGYRLTPDAVEFWQGRPDRLHDRLRYVRGEGGLWRVERLCP